MNSSDGFSRNKTLLTAAVGMGVLMGAAGLFTYYAIESKKKSKSKQNSFSHLYEEFLSQRNIKELSGSRESLTSTSTKTSSFNGRSEYDTCNELYSALSSGEEDELYFDCDEDDEALAESLRVNRNNENIRLSKLFDEVDGLMKGNDDDRLKAFNLLKKKEFDLSENPDFLWRFAKAHQILALVRGSHNDLESKRRLVFEGSEYASKALALDWENPDAHKWLAILVGMQGDFVSIKERIEKAYVFQKHLLVALKYKVNDYSLHYLLARFKYEVANTSWWERKMASTLFAELPSFTYSDAIPHLLKAEELNPVPWKENRLLLAKCYAGDGNHEEAIRWLESAKQVIGKTKEDEGFDREIAFLIEKYQKGRK